MMWSLLGGSGVGLNKGENSRIRLSGTERSEGKGAPATLKRPGAVRLKMSLRATPPRPHWMVEHDGRASQSLGGVRARDPSERRTGASVHGEQPAAAGPVLWSTAAERRDAVETFVIALCSGGVGCEEDFDGGGRCEQQQRDRGSEGGRAPVGALGAVAGIPVAAGEGAGPDARGDAGGSGFER